SADSLTLPVSHRKSSRAVDRRHFPSRPKQPPTRHPTPSRLPAPRPIHPRSLTLLPASHPRVAHDSSYTQSHPPWTSSFPSPPPIAQLRRNPSDEFPAESRGPKLERAMATCRKMARVDVGDLKQRLVKRLGRQRAGKYFAHLTRLLNLKLTKVEFDRLCCATIGKENIALHNALIKGIISNALSGVPPPSRQAVTGQSGTTTAPSGQCVGVVLPVLGNVGAVVDSGDGELARERGAPVGKVVSVEDGEEVEQVRSAPCVQSRSPITAPLGISVAGSSGVRMRRTNDPEALCYDSTHLLDTGALCEALQKRLHSDGVGVTVHAAEALNRGLDEFLRRLIKPCMDLSRVRASSRRIGKVNERFAGRMNALQQPNQGHCTTLQDFAVAMQSDPRSLGPNWPTLMEKIQTMSFGGE
ncbi:hypothetical protein U9M48_010658, partial [Paspalum notatum var. saurae]